MAQSLLPCPHCQTKLAVPDEFRGKVISCLECKTLLMAPPLGDSGELTIVPKKLARGGFPPRVFVPMAALILLGFAGILVNGYYAYQFSTDPASLEQYADSTLAQMGAIQMFGKKKDDGEQNADAEANARRAKEWVADKGQRMTMVAYAFVGVSLLETIGGLTFAFRRPYWLGWLGCLAAVLNINHGCCFPGAVAGIWGAAVLVSNEGRRYFGLDSVSSTKTIG